MHFPLHPLSPPGVPKVKVIKKVGSPEDFLTAYQEFLDENKPDTGEAHMSVRCLLPSGHTDEPHTFNVGVTMFGKEKQK